jgi:hypothetical protein
MMAASTVYRIRVQGHLRPEWSEWFGGMTITLEEDGNTILSGPVADQPALHGLLVQVRDLGLVLLSVDRVEDEENAPLQNTGTGEAVPDRL